MYARPVPVVIFSADLGFIAFLPRRKNGMMG